MKKTLAAAAVVLFALALFVGGTLLPGRGSTPTTAPLSKAEVDALLAPGAGSDVNTRIAALRTKIANGDAIASDHSSLAFGYLQKARVDADPAMYDEAEAALDASFEKVPAANFEATLGTAILAGSRHDFHGQLDWGRRAVKINPYNSQALGIVGDAYLELGLSREAHRTYQRMIDIRPDLASFGRISHTSKLRGDTDGAIAAMERALDFAGTSRDNAAWAHWQLGELHIGAHDFARAEEHLQDALSLAPSFGSAIESTAHLTAARGDTEGAIGILSRLVKDFPLPGNFAFLGELYLLDGDETKAEAAFAEADRRLALYQEHDVRTDVDFITFWADRKIHLDRALSDARMLYSQRKSAAVSDALAWALYANGRYQDAEPYAREALERSVNDAGYHYHAGMIASALGQTNEARSLLSQALELDPSWSIIESHRARRILRSMP